MLSNRLGDNVAVLFVMAATFMMATQDALIKLLTSDVSIWQLFVIRSLLSISVLCAFACVFPLRESLLPTQRKWSLLRSSLMTFMYLAYFTALSLLDLSMVAAAYYTSPIFIALIAFYLARQINLWQIAFIGVGFVGVLIIINPFSDTLTAWVFVPILSAILYASAMVLTKVKCQDESPLSLVLSLNVGSLFYSTLALLIIHGFGIMSDEHYLLKPWRPLPLDTWGWISLLVLLNVGIHWFLSKAYQIGKPVVVAGFDYSYLLFAAFWGYVLLGEQVAVNTIIGAVLIDASGILLLKSQKRSQL